MKTYKKTLIIALVMALVVPTTAFVTTPQAEASCSYQGYSSSKGKCDKSKKWDYSYKSDWDDDFEDGWYYWDDSDNWNQRINNNHFNHYDYNSQIGYLLVLISQLQNLLREGQGDFGNNYDDEDFNVKTQKATNIEDDSAELQGYVDIDDVDEVSTWFEYGKNRNRLNFSTTNTNSVSSRNVSVEINNLDEDTQYYFRIVGRDDENDIDYGSILSFRTDEDSNDDNDDDNYNLPEVETDNAKNVSDDSAELRGNIDMNDFDNGHSFFVYGEDEDLVGDIESEYDNFSDIDEDGDNLQKMWGSSGFNVSADIYGLDDDTTYYFSLCVEYESEDGDSDIICGDVEEFETDSN